MDKALARKLLGLPADVPLLLFGAMGGGQDPRKGFDLLAGALQYLRGKVPGMELVVFGQRAPQQPPELGFPVHFTGHLHDDLSLRALYCAADALVVPSRQDNLPNTAVEAQACGTPVVAFDVGGLPDIVEHMVTGYLARAHDPVDMANGFKWLLNKNADIAQIRSDARSKAIIKWSFSSIAEAYSMEYKDILITKLRI